MKYLNKALVSLSFDDGRKDTLDVYEKVLYPMCIPATVNIVSNLPIFGHCCHPIFAHKSIKKVAEAAASFNEVFDPNHPDTFFEKV